MHYGQAIMQLSKEYNTGPRFLRLVGCYNGPSRFCDVCGRLPRVHFVYLEQPPLKPTFVHALQATQIGLMFQLVAPDGFKEGSQTYASVKIGTTARAKAIIRPHTKLEELVSSGVAKLDSSSYQASTWSAININGPERQYDAVHVNREGQTTSEVLWF